MPYATDYTGVYKIVNTATNECYVGQSQRIKKRIKEHFRLLDLGKHPNDHLQKAYNKYGADNFQATIEIVCGDNDELDMLEEMFINGSATFDEPSVYNIASFVKAPMRGKKHTEQTKQKIREAKLRACFDYTNPDWRAKLSAGQQNRKFNNPIWVAKLKTILDNDHMSYAARARLVGGDTSSVRRMYLKHQHLKGAI